MSDPNQKTETTGAEDLRALLQEAEEALSQTAGAAGDKFDELRNRLRATLDQGRYSLSRIRSEAVRRAKQADHLVHEHPYYAVGVAAGVGALVGIIVSRSCNGSR